MKLNELFLFNFRNFRSLELSFSEKSWFFGANGVGKTSLLEAIYMLCWGKSFRVSRDSEVIRWGESSSRIEGGFKGEEFYNIKVSFSSGGKRILLNGKQISRAELIGKVPVLLLSPEELSMVDGPPKLRRDFLNKLLAQMDSEYLAKYRLYLRLLKEKNSLLSQDSVSFKLLDFIDERIFKASIYIWKKRERLLSALAGEEILIKFKPSGMDIEVDEELLKRRMFSCKDREIKRGFSLFGPHLDDFEIMKDGMSLKRYGSRGERKWVIWKIYLKALNALKIAGRTPIFLVDEILAELDSSRRKTVIEDLFRLKGQVVVTSLFLEKEEGFSVFEVRDGTVKRYNS